MISMCELILTDQTKQGIITRQMLVASWGEPEVQQLVHCITQTV